MRGKSIPRGCLLHQRTECRRVVQIVDFHTVPPGQVDVVAGLLLHPGEDLLLTTGQVDGNGTGRLHGKRGWREAQGREIVSGRFSVGKVGLEDQGDGPLRPREAVEAGEKEPQRFGCGGHRPARQVAQTETKRQAPEQDQRACLAFNDRLCGPSKSGFQFTPFARLGDVRHGGIREKGIPRAGFVHAAIISAGLHHRT